VRDVDRDHATGVSGHDPRRVRPGLGVLEELEGKAALRILELVVEGQAELVEGVDETALRGLELVPEPVVAGA
jgi:hypothetical protein